MDVKLSMNEGGEKNGSFWFNRMNVILSDIISHLFYVSSMNVNISVMKGKFS
jgi:hypothetical protein